MKTVTLTELRRNIFRLVDEALETGEPIEVHRKGRRMVLRSEGPSRPGSAETEEERDARWRKFWAEPPEIDEDLSLEEIEAAGEAYWRPADNPLRDP